MTPLRARGMLLALIILLQSVAVVADPKLFVRNRPFTGAVVGSGEAMKVELEPLAKALGISLTASNAGWVVGEAPAPAPEAPAPEASPSEARVVAFGDKTVPVEGTADGKSLVNLKQFCQAAGARVVPNKSLGTVDVYMAGGSGAAGDFSNIPTVVLPNAPPSQVVLGYFGSFRLLESLPAVGSGQLLSFFKEPARFIKGLDQCQAQVKPLVSKEYYAEWSQRFDNLRDRLSDCTRIFNRMKSSEKAQVEKELNADADFRKVWGIAARLWDALRFSQVKVLREQINGDQATVDIQATLPGLGTSNGRVELIKQDGRWKIIKAPQPPK